MSRPGLGPAVKHPVVLPAGAVTLNADLVVPESARGLVVFAHGSGSGRHSPRNRHVAERLHEMGLATMLLDLLSVPEEAFDLQTAELRFDVGLLAERLVKATQWLSGNEDTRSLVVGYFGASTGAAAALVAAAAKGEEIGAVVSRGGRPDLAGPVLPLVKAPVLLVVGGDDTPVIEINRRAGERLTAPHQLIIVPGATHLFEEPGALDEVARLAGEWFTKYLR